MVKKILIISTIILGGLFGFYIINEARGIEEVSKTDPNPMVTITLEDDVMIKIELFPKEAPNTVNNFIALIESRFYDGLLINKVIPGYLVQTGDPIGNGSGFPGYFIASECKKNGIRNKLKCKKGTLCMARSKRYNTEGSQFFILLQDDSNLDGYYTSFGRVVEGMEIIENMGNTPVDSQNRPIEEIRIKSMIADTFGMSYSEPKVIALEEARYQNVIE